MNFLREKPLLILVFSGLVFYLAGGIVILASLQELSSPLVIHFDGFNGVDFFGTEGSLWSIWILGVIIGILNTAFGEMLFSRERIISYIFFVMTTILSLIALITASVIVTIN